VPLPPWPLPATIAYAGLGIRALALVIDGLSSLVVAIPLAASQGGLQASNGSFRAELTGVPFLVAVVAWLAYMTLAETTVGASLGKLLVGSGSAEWTAADSPSPAPRSAISSA
jgi:uncharacterized RDD family membrane protein YckC